jgi:glyceraldehyde-3-phosphate dehydrogenase (NADP+)
MVIDTLSSLSEKITLAEMAQKKWKKTSLNERIEFINKFNEIYISKKQEFVNLLISEIYKPKTQAEEEVERTFDMTTAFCEEVRSISGEIRESGGYRGNLNNKLAIIGRQPLGTVLCISPFNYPVNESLAKIIPALLMGNAVLFKSASVAIKIGELIEKCFREAEMFDGVFNLITIFSKTVKRCDSETVDKNLLNKKQLYSATVSPFHSFTGNGSLMDFVVSHPLVDAINFTGSTETAEHIAGICGIKKLAMGLSGKDASIVLADADLDLAALEIVSGAFSYSGQRCTGVKKVIVQENIIDEFVKKLKLKIEMNLIAGKLDDEKTNFGPMLLETHGDYVEELLIDSENQGGKIEKIQIMGGEWARQAWGKRFMLPTIIMNVSREMRINWEEPFAPILPIVVFKTIDEAIRMVNQSAYGLQNSVFTKDINLALKTAEELECGVCNINGKDARGPDNFPFLGIKKSGIGVVGGIKYILQEMSTIKSIVINEQFF